MKHVTVSGCMGDRIKYGRHLVATIPPSADPEAVKEFWNLIRVAPGLLDILKRLLPALVSENGMPYEQDMEDRIVEAQHLIAQAEGKEE